MSNTSLQAKELYAPYRFTVDDYYRMAAPAFSNSGTSPFPNQKLEVYRGPDKRGYRAGEPAHAEYVHARRIGSWSADRFMQHRQNRCPDRSPFQCPDPTVRLRPHRSSLAASS